MLFRVSLEMNRLVVDVRGPLQKQAFGKRNASNGRMVGNSYLTGLWKGSPYSGHNPEGGTNATIGQVRQISSNRTGQSKFAWDSYLGHCSLAYSALAFWRMGTSGSESFHSVKKSW